MINDWDITIKKNPSLEFSEANHELFIFSLDYRQTVMQVPCAKTQLSKRSSQRIRHACSKEAEVNELR